MLNMFLYGTLRKGEANDIYDLAVDHGLTAPRFVGPATVRGRLYDFGKYPGLVSASDGGPVIGEVYEIEDELRAVLDEVERAYPENETLFSLEVIDLNVDGQTVACLFYPVSAASVLDLPEIRSGNWVEHRRSRTTKN